MWYPVKVHIFKKDLCFIVAKSNLIRKHKEKLQESESVYPHQVPLLTAEYQREMAALEKQNKDEITRFDMKLILQLDQKVSNTANVVATHQLCMVK